MPYVSAENHNDSDAINCHCCDKEISLIEHYLKCDKCSRIFRPKCLGITGININRAASNDTWYCKECKSSTPVQLKRKNSPDKDPVSKRIDNRSSPHIDKLDQILNAINGLNVKYSEIKKVTTEIQTNQKIICQQLHELNKKVENVSKENDLIKKNVIKLEKNQIEQYKLINVLEAEVDTHNQNMLTNNLIIGGLPHNTDPRNAMEKIMSSLKTKCTIDDVDKLIFLSSKQSQPSNSASTRSDKSAPLLLVKFKNINAKLEIKQKKKEKRSLFVNEIGLNSGSDKQIFIRDHVTQYKKNLFNECRVVKSTYDFKFLWMDNSRILIRKQENSKIYSINNRNDLNHLVSIFCNNINYPQSQQQNVRNSFIFDNSVSINHTSTELN